MSSCGTRREVYAARVRQGKPWGGVGGYADTSEAAERIAILAARFSGDFERGVLHALNGGGQNMSRACLTGALLGAQPQGRQAGDRL